MTCYVHFLTRGSSLRIHQFYLFTSERRQLHLDVNGKHPQCIYPILISGYSKDSPFVLSGSICEKWFWNLPQVAIEPGDGIFRFPTKKKGLVESPHCILLSRRPKRQKMIPRKIFGSVFFQVTFLRHLRTISSLLIYMNHIINKTLASWRFGWSKPSSDIFQLIASNCILSNPKDPDMP